MKLRGLRQARQRLGMSIGQLAETTDLRRETISRLEHGQEEPQPYALRRLIAALGVTHEDLCGIATPVISWSEATSERIAVLVEQR